MLKRTLLLLAFVSVVGARAEAETIIDFTLVVTGTGDTYTWSLPSDPEFTFFPISIPCCPMGIFIDPVAVSVNGGSPVDVRLTLPFTDFGGGLFFGPPIGLSFGSKSMDSSQNIFMRNGSIGPVFEPGMFELVFPAATLTMTAAVPEPATMTLLAVGLAGAGVRRWRRRRL